MCLLNFLTLNNEHKVMSFTFLGSFNYCTHSMFEYLMHSLSLVFMIFQAINL